MPDPLHRHELRYWDGSAWTAHVSDAGLPTRDPAGLEPIAPGAQHEERVLAVIPDAGLKSGRVDVWRKRHTLVLTDRRMIFARKTKAGLKQRIAVAQDSGESTGSGRLGRTAGAMDALVGWDEDRYLAMSPEQVLAETPDNFAVDNGVDPVSLTP